MTGSELQILKNKYDIIGNDPQLNRALEVAVAVAPTDITVLITGESGVGKENLPRIIHNNSRRKNGKYFAVNCGAIPEGTIDSELFGHEKGSFTGANEMRKGYFEEADGGTLFLDEIGEMPLASQAKLLRVLQSGEFIRVGSSKVLKTDVRVIAATNVNLMHAVSKGKFREDLYYRLNAVNISMPALRERPADINLLFRKFASDFSTRYGMARITLDEDASILLRRYRWPGNIRQLKNVAETITAIEAGALASPSEKCVITASIISKYIPKDEPNLLPVKSSVWQETTDGNSEREAIIRTLFQLKQDVEYLKGIVAKAGLTDKAAPHLHTAIPMPESTDNEAYNVDDKWIIQPEEDPEEQEAKASSEEDEDMTVNSNYQALIKKALQKHNGNRKAAAEELGISERTLYRKLKSM